MQPVFAKLNYAFGVLMLTVLINIGCSLGFLEQSQKTVNSEEFQKSFLTIVDTSNVNNPTLSGSIQLPFRINQNNAVVLSGKHAYVTTEKHLHVIDVSNRQQPIHIASTIFPDEIGQMRVSDNQVFVASRNKIHLVDVSNSLQPVGQWTVSLHQANVIRAFDIRESFLYIMDIYDYVHIFSVEEGNAQFVETVGTTNPSALVGIRAKGPQVERVLLEHRTPGDYGWLALARTDLIELSGRYKKVRVAGDDLVLARRSYDIRELEIFWGKNQLLPDKWPWIERYHIEKNYLAHLYLSGKEKLNHGKPTDAIIDHSNKIQLIAQDQWSETITFEENRLLGPITDFQVSQKLLYVANAKGFLSIIDLNPQKKDRFLSATKFQDQHPISIAVGENYVCVLTSSWSGIGVTRYQ